MAAIAEETEQERLAREEQEAAQAEMERLLATRIAPPDSQLPQTAIPAENVAFTNGADGQIQIDTPEGFAPTFDRQMIGDAQYQNELARAQRGNGFLNADAGPAGNTIVPGYDPAIAEAAQRRQQEKLAAQAERFTGAQGYQQSLQSGATPAEALALWGSKMFAGDPKGLVNLATRREPLKSSLEPEVTNVDGVKMYRTGPNSFAQARPELPAKPPPETVAGQKILTGQITDARKDLDRAEKVAAEDRSDVNAVNAALRARSKLRGLEENFMRGSTQWMQGASAPAKQAAAPVEETITSKEQFDRLPSGSVYTGKDGKKRRKP